MPIAIFFAIFAGALVVAIRAPHLRLAAGGIAAFCTVLLGVLVMTTNTFGPDETARIAPEQLTLTDLTIGTDPRFVRINGRVTNGNEADRLRAFTLLATLHDCPAADSPWDSCAIIAQSEGIARVDVPPGQTRDFTAVLQFTGRPKAKGVEVWEYLVVETRASDRLPG